MSLMVKSLNRLLDERVDDVCDEAEHQRGMADRVGKVLLAVERLPPHIDKTQLEDSVWSWWHQMLRWSHARLSQATKSSTMQWLQPIKERLGSLYQPTDVYHHYLVLIR